MNTLFLANAGAAGGSNMMMIILFIVLIGFTYFGMIRPQKKQQQQRLQMMDKLKKGDGVVLVDGLHAKVDKINSDKTIVVDADGIYLTFERMAVRRVIPAAAPVEENDAPAADKTEDAPAKEDTKSTDASSDETKEDK
ncbi:MULTISPECIES: preprotein translocase subunit YajC [Lactobacillus]|uniref:preprotein translocase subunit YajC n=1 Tax=Lactobacillus TaxID=1578 RepID=UPI001853D7A1|nr:MULTISPECIES: preprotein translocase subunit YajC [Lactobacillus]MBM6973116.1 preprotein translocase subunit YajC [Lactobacillus gallinarum]NMB31761.1 preprotein translocase subunit YajC [Lactobacillus sp.]